MKLVQRGNRQLRVADDRLEDMRQAGYVEVDAGTGKPVDVPAAESEADALKKENKRLRAQVKELTAQVEALTQKSGG